MVSGFTKATGNEQEMCTCEWRESGLTTKRKMYSVCFMELIESDLLSLFLLNQDMIHLLDFISQYCAGSDYFTLKCCN